MVLSIDHAVGSEHDQGDDARAPSTDGVPLSSLRVGDHARLIAGGSREERATLDALGLSSTRPFRVARAGDPWIVQVRSTRIGLADVVARGLKVMPEAQ